MPIENERRRAQRVAQEKGQILILALDSCLLLFELLCFSLSCYACVCARVARENQALVRNDWYAILRQVKLFVVVVMVVMPATSLS